MRQSHLKNLREIEEALDAEFGAETEESDQDKDEKNDFFCIFCEKAFKSKWETFLIIAVFYSILRATHLHFSACLGTAACCFFFF